MKWIKFFEDFKNNNEEGTLITQDDVIKCIEKSGRVFATIIKGFPDNDPGEPIRPVDIDEDGVVTVDISGKLYTVNLKDIEKIEF
jgi:hypothetical protein